MINRDTVTVAIIWIVATIAVEFAFTFVDLFPVAASEEAVIVDDAFYFLTYAAIPVFTLILVALIYSIFKFRSRSTADGGPPEDGPPMRTHHAWVRGWMVVSTALVIGVIIHPGLSGLFALEYAENEDHL